MPHIVFARDRDVTHEETTMTEHRDTFRYKAFCHMIIIQVALLLALCETITIVLGRDTY